MKVLLSFVTILFAGFPLQCNAKGIIRRRVGEQQDDGGVQLNAQFNAKESRIVGGYEGNVSNYPHFVELGIGCGASLIYEDIILTAAHCLAFLWNPQVYVGSQDSGSGLYNSVAATSPHPRYDNWTLEYDYMVMKLTNAVPSSVIPVQLNNNASHPSTGDDLTIMGHGNLQWLAWFGSNTLQEMIVPFVSFQECEQDWPGEVYDNVMLCAGEAGKAVCQGDSGGPVLDSKGVQVGVTSFGYMCGHQGVPDVHARVSFVYDWIQEQICLLSANPPASSCGSNRKRVRIEFLFDYNPEESQWILTDNNSGDILLYQEINVQIFDYTMDINLQPGSYTFEIHDIGGNGICCMSGDGFYSIVANGTAIDRDGQFTYDDRVVFLVDKNGQLTEVP